ncbi:MAG: bifunctional diguanylate cyclase/phosphodiesterase [Sulfurospirillaceae bacterium]|nr:bifunctional diguanylate cyclase/phosphodiesterase [Sulfurospirillaceae bacterium]
MRHLIHKVLFNYIVILILCFVISIVLSVGTHMTFLHFTALLDQHEEHLKTKVDINRYILEDITSLHLLLLELTAATKNKTERAATILEIRQLLDLTQEHLFVANNGGLFEKELSKKYQQTINIPYQNTTIDLDSSAQNAKLEIQLTHIVSILDNLSLLLEQRDTLFELKNVGEQQALAQKIRGFNANISSTFEEIEAKINQIILADTQELTATKIKNAHQSHLYTIFEALLIMITACIVSFVIYKIIGHIINLYKELENKLYIDALTKLHNRFSLLRELEHAQNPAMILLNINAFRTINELYGVEVGNDVLLALANTLKIFAASHHFRVYRIAGDEFVLYKDNVDANQAQCISLLEKLFQTIENKKMYIVAIEDFIYLDLSAGISFEKENTFGTADIALNKAKELHVEYVFYDKTFDAITEIRHSTQWKKRIIQGIEKECFIPFFQPIVDRNQTIIKYEALMRLKENSEGNITYTSPSFFLDLASKTRHYNQISKMTLMQSFAVCASQHIPISVNLSYQDILNEPLHDELKKFITEHAIGHLLIFEILESESIRNYKILQSFIHDFRTYGVRFAIDDFGTGFSNFSHIFELSPDFIKIDGSLIKNIHTEKRSYELVKAIVFFSKELGIKTVAEFVHSKEVFEIAYNLGVDEFQGYYFGEPKATLSSS